MKIIDLLRAKSKDRNAYLLKDHLKETILRVAQLREFIIQNRFAIKYSNFFDSTFFEDLIIASFLHDLGKINFNFQKTVFKKEERETEEFKKIEDFFGKYKKIDVRHEIISLIYSLIFLDNSDRAKKIRTAILLHHYNDFYTKRDSIDIGNIIDYYPDLKVYTEFLVDNKGKISELLEDLLKYLLESIRDNSVSTILNQLRNNINLNKIEEFKQFLEEEDGLSPLELFDLPDKENKDNLKLFYDFFVFLGCLRRCDYAASGEVDVEYIRNLSECVYKDLDKKIKDKIESEFIWQEKILEENDSDNLVLIAPTGSGKTEFGVLWAKKRGKKLIYTLPLRVAINDLYWRFTDKDKGYFRNDSEKLVSILHSTSFIEYLKEGRYERKLSIDEKQTVSELFSSPIILTTPDQVFLTSLKYYGFDKVVSIYPLSSMIIDEIQTYNPEMAAIIIKTLEIVKELSGSILILTATFPPYLTKFINEGRGFKIVDIKNTDSEIKSRVKNYNLKRHRIKILSYQLFEYGDKEDELIINNQAYEEIKKILFENKDKNILIILNNVRKAIELYKKLEKESEINRRIIVNDKNNKPVPLLLHARIIEKEKSKRIEAIKENLRNNKKGMIVVSTQLVEVSVDIDFDLLITEISPVDSQIQRWGRVYRNRKTDYNDSSPNIFILTGIDRGTIAIYDKRVIEKTIEILKKYEGRLLDYELERKIIEEVFDSKVNDENLTLKDVFIKEIEENLKWLEYLSLEKKSEAQRIFRGLAGFQIVILEFIKESENELEKIFGKIMDEIIKNKKYESVSWKELIEEVKKRVSNDKIKERSDDDLKYELKKVLYDYSVNIPYFLLSSIHAKLIPFKEFYVLYDEKIKELYYEIMNYGIGKDFWKNLHLEEIS